MHNVKDEGERANPSRAQYNISHILPKLNIIYNIFISSSNIIIEKFDQLSKQRRGGGISVIDYVDYDDDDDDEVEVDVDVDDGDGDGDVSGIAVYDDDYDIYIMMKCLCVCHEKSSLPPGSLL